MSRTKVVAGGAACLLIAALSLSACKPKADNTAPAAAVATPADAALDAAASQDAAAAVEAAMAASPSASDPLTSDAAAASASS